MNTVVVIYSDARDPLLKVLKFIDGVVYFHIDTICQSIGQNSWQGFYAFLDPTMLDVMKGALVFNRVFGLDGTQASTILQDKGVHIGWLHRYIGRLTKSAVTTIHDIGQRGISRSHLPLNTQWYTISQAMPNILTPKFAFGFNGSTPALDNLNMPMLKSVWSYNAWHKETCITEIEQRWNRFFVEIPVGTPVVVSFYGNAYRIYYPDGVAVVDCFNVESLIESCRQQFKTEIGDIIAYVKNDILTFCACSPYVGFGLRQGDFIDVVVDGCKKFISKAPTAAVGCLPLNRC